MGRDQRFFAVGIAIEVGSILQDFIAWRHAS